MMGGVTLFQHDGGVPSNVLIKFMVHRVFQKIKFLLTSTNQHGVHSPFVFEYLTKCLYQKKIYSKSKKIDILVKSISYFEYENVQVVGNENVKELIRQKFEDIEFDKHANDLIFLEKTDPDSLLMLLSEGKIDNDSMVLINDIHRNKYTTEIWNLIIAMEKATVTIDFFYCGAIFFRQEQVKEHFKVRI